MKNKVIRINAVSPRPIQTPAIDDSADTEEQAKKFKDPIVSMILPGRIGQPEEVAAAVDFLVSGESSFVNDSELLTDSRMPQYLFFCEKPHEESPSNSTGFLALASRPKQVYFIAERLILQR